MIKTLIIPEHVQEVDGGTNGDVAARAEHLESISTGPASQVTEHYAHASKSEANYHGDAHHAFYAIQPLD